MTAAVRVVDGGFLTTIQDLGRFGYQRYGVPVSGAMDRRALRAANVLVGNDPTAAGLEMTLNGSRLEFTREVVIAICGADFTPSLDGRPCAMWQATIASTGSQLAFGAPRSGARVYLALAGGIDVPVVLGSRSTYMRARLGGFEGRPIRAGDILRVFPPATRPADRSCPSHLVPVYGREHVLRVILGPHDAAFTAEGLWTFLSQTYIVSGQSDRVGWRLQGPRIAHRAGHDIISDGTPFGGVQIAGDGQPMVLAADRGTIGGYTKIANVVSVDLQCLAQANQGDRVRFRAVSVADGRRLVLNQEAWFQSLTR